MNYQPQAPTDLPRRKTLFIHWKGEKNISYPCWEWNINSVSPGQSVVDILYTLSHAIIITIIIIIIIISFMQGIYTSIPETNYVPREYSVAAILLLLFMVLISLVSVLSLLYFYFSTLRSVCAVPNMAVFCSFIIIIIIIIIITIIITL